MKPEGIYLVELRKKSKANKPIPIHLDIQAPNTIKELFATSRDIVARLGDQIQQIYYTVGHVKIDEKNRRDGISQTEILIDIDHIIKDRRDEYINLFCETTGFDAGKIGIVDSGYGLQLIIGIEKPATKVDWAKHGELFKKWAKTFDTVMDLRGLVFKGIEGGISVQTQVDTKVFRLCSLARMPWTINHDPAKNRELRHTSLIQGNIEPQAFDLGALALTLLGGGGATEDFSVFTDIKIDGEYVKANCGYLRWALDNPKEVHEGDFFFCIGLLKHCGTDEEDGLHLCMEWFEKLKREGASASISGYSEKDALEKIARALPISYEKIDAHSDKSKNDPGRPKIKHPFQMKSKAFVLTQAKENGFHKSKRNSNGSITLVPDYESLRDFFEELHPYVACNEVCWRFNGKFFERIENDALRNFAQTHFSPYATNRMVDEFKSLVLRTNIKLLEAWSSGPENHACFQNGVLNLTKKEFILHDESKSTMRFMFKAALPYNYDPIAKAPTFLRALDAMVGGIDEFKQCILEYFGYAISGCAIWLPQTLLLLGPDGGGGKSTIIRILKAVVGKGYYSAIALDDLNDAQNRAMLEGKYFNVFDESEASKYMNGKIWKALTAGGEVSVKTVYEKPYTIVNRAKMIYAANHVPKSTDTTQSFFRRWIVIPFLRNFVEDGTEDPFIEEKIMQELPGIFNLFIDAYAKLSERKRFDVGPHMKQALAEFKSEVDPFEAWWGDCVIDTKDTEQIIPAKKLFEEFRRYCEEQNEMVSMRLATQRGVTQKIVRKVGKTRHIKRRIGTGNPTWVIAGVRINGDA